MCSPDNCPQFLCVHCAPHSLPAGCWCCTQICSLFTQHSGVCGGWGGARLISALLQVCLYVYDIRWDVAWILAFDNLCTCEVLSLVVTHTWLCLQQSSGHTSPQVTSTDSWMEQSAWCSTTRTHTHEHTHTYMQGNHAQHECTQTDTLYCRESVSKPVLERSWMSVNLRSSTAIKTTRHKDHPT